jgi:hypothetical protein
MNRSQLFITVSLTLLITGGWLFFHLSKPLRKDATVKAVNANKEKGFREEVVILDSLYKDYVAVLATNDQSAIAGADALLNSQFSIIKKQYAGSSAPAILAAKLIRNYEVRVLLNQKVLDRKNMQLDEVNRLKKLVKKLDEENKDLKTQNQMVQQALLSLPQ